MWLRYLYFFCWGCFLLLTTTGVRSVSAQVTMEFEIEETLKNSQAINIQSLIANDLKGPKLFQLFLQNQSSTKSLNDLYLRVVVESDEIGRIVEVEQSSENPFTLDPGQQVYADNNNSRNGLPGVDENMYFDRNFTEHGKEFYNELQGSTSLPSDTYRVTVQVYQGTVNGEMLASQTEEVGANIVEDTRDFYLLSPGDELGSESIVSNQYPNFQWQGETGVQYRLLVVESKSDESPQSLMEGAMSTDPIQSAGSSTAGSLLDYEMLDIIVDGSGYQYPNSGVQELDPDTEYYWQIVRQVETNSGLEERESEIWNFTLADLQGSNTAEVSDETVRALKNVLGERFEELQQDGFSLESIEVDGQNLQSAEAVQKIMELARKNEQGNISIVIEN